MGLILYVFGQLLWRECSARMSQAASSSAALGTASQVNRCRRLHVPIRTLLPTYQKDRQQCRREILENVRKAAALRGIQYKDDDLLEAEVVLYLKSGKRHDIHDVDNRLKIS